MKFKIPFLVLLMALNVFAANAAMDMDEEVLPSEESIIATNSTPTNPPVIIDETDAEDVSDVDEYDN